MAKYVRNQKNWNGVKDATLQGLMWGGVFTQARLKQKLSLPGTGSFSGGARYQRSAPGAPPTVQTGTLRRSIQIDATLARRTLQKIRVGTNLSYARMLEFGTRKMAPRPFMRPLAQDPSFNLELQNGMATVIRRAMPKGK